MSAAPPAAWVLLRGLTRERGHWGDFPEQLRARLPEGTRIVMLDLPGNGIWHRLPSPTRIDATTAWCRARLRDEQGLATAPVVLLAMSLGAMVAVDWVQRAPREIAGAVLINTSLRPFSPWHQRLRPAALAALLRIAFAARDAAARERAILRLTSAHPQAHARAIDDWVRLRAQHPVTRLNALRQLLAAARFRADAHAPGVPLLVLGGARDTLADVRCSQRLAQRWHADLELHPQAGHDLPLDDADWVIERSAGWWARRARGGYGSPA